jgi:GNAT superfamily N-acetyltransferase
MEGMIATAVETDVRVRPVRGSSDLRRFIDFPYRHYAGNPYWVAPLRRDVAHTLDPKKNAFFEHGTIHPFIAEDQSGRVVGRIAAIINGMHLKKYNDGIGFFGFFECINSEGIAFALFDAATAWLREKGMTGVRGPTNPSLNDTAGLLTEGFDREPSILMPYNPPYYENLLTAYGFERVKTMWAYYVHKKYVQIEKLKRGVELVRKRTPGLHIRPLDMSRFDEEAQNILRIYNDAWSKNWGHVPMTEREFAHLAKEMKQIVDPRIVFVVEHENEPVAFSISLPNLNQALKFVPSGRLFPAGLPQLLARSKFGGIYECRMPLMGVMLKYQGRGLDSLLILETIMEGPKYGYDACEMSWVLDENYRLRNALDALGGVIDKQYAMFEKPL